MTVVAPGVRPQAARPRPAPVLRFSLEQNRRTLENRGCIWCRFTGERFCQLSFLWKHLCVPPFLKNISAGYRIAGHSWQHPEDGLPCLRVPTSVRVVAPVWMACLPGCSTGRAKVGSPLHVRHRSSFLC